MIKKQIPNLQLPVLQFFNVLICVLMVLIAIGFTGSIPTAHAFTSADCLNGWDQKSAQLRIDKQVVHPTEPFFVYVKITYLNAELASLCATQRPSLQLVYASKIDNYNTKQTTANISPKVLLVGGNPAGLYTTVKVNLVGQTENIQQETIEFSAKLVSEAGSSGFIGSPKRINLDVSKPAPNPITDQLPSENVNTAQTANGTFVQAGSDEISISASCFEYPSTCLSVFAPVTATLTSFVKKVIIAMVKIYTQIISGLFFFFITPVLNALLDVRPYSDAFVNIIYPGWVILRNFANIAFIVALLVMGLRILFQQEESSKTRPFIINLVIMALLVNFSLVIAQGVVAIADTVQSQFLPADQKVIDTLAKKLMIDPAIKYRYEDNASTGGTDDVADILKPMALYVLTLVAMVTFIALIGFVFIRLVALWVLYMLSPVAYFGAVLPQTASIANKWWEEFIKYTVMVPVLVFFLNIAALMADTFSQTKGGTIPIFQREGVSYLEKLPPTSQDIVQFALTIITFFIPMIFIFLGMKYAMDSGTYGAKKIGDVSKGIGTFVGSTVPKWLGKKTMQGAQFGAQKGLGAGSNYAADKKWDNTAQRLAILRNPGVFKDKVKATRAGNKKFADEQIQDRMGGMSIPLGKLGSFALTKENRPNKFGASLAKPIAIQKDFFDKSKGTMADTLQESIKKNKRDEAVAAVLTMAQEGHQEAMLERMETEKGKIYSKDRAGMISMTNDLVFDRVMTAEQQVELLFLNDRAAEKNKEIAHFGNTVKRDKDEKGNPIYKPLSIERDNDHKFQPDKLDATNFEEITAKRIDKRSEKGLHNDLKDSGIGAMIHKDKNGNLKFTDEMLGVIAKTDPNALADRKAAYQFQTGKPANFQQMQEAFSTTDEKDIRNAFETQYKRDKRDVSDPKVSEEIDQKVKEFRSTLMTPMFVNPKGGYETAVEKAVREKNESSKTKEEPEKEPVKETKVNTNIKAKNDAIKAENAAKAREKAASKAKADSKDGGTSSPTASTGGGSGYVTVAPVSGSTLSDDAKEDIKMSVESADKSERAKTKFSSDPIGKAGDEASAGKFGSFDQGLNMSPSIDGINTSVKGEAPKGPSGITGTNTSSSDQPSSGTFNSGVRSNDSTSSSGTPTTPTTPKVFIAGGGVAMPATPQIGKAYLEKSGNAAAKPGEDVVNFSKSNNATSGGHENNPPTKPQPKPIGFVNAGTAKTPTGIGNVKTTPSVPQKISSYSPASSKIPQDIRVKGQSNGDRILYKGMLGVNPETGAIGQVDGKKITSGKIQYRARSGQAGSNLEAVPNYNYVESPDEYKSLSKFYNVPEGMAKSKYITVTQPAIVEQTGDTFKVTKGKLELSDTPPTITP